MIFNNLYNSTDNTEPFTTSNERSARLLEDSLAARVRGDVEVSRRLHDIWKVEVETIRPRIENYRALYLFEQRQTQIERAQAHEQDQYELADTLLAPVEGDELQEEWNSTLFDAEMEQVDNDDLGSIIVEQAQADSATEMDVETLDDAAYDAQLLGALNAHLGSPSEHEFSLDNRNQGSFSRG